MLRVSVLCSDRSIRTSVDIQRLGSHSHDMRIWVCVQVVIYSSVMVSRGKGRIERMHMVWMQLMMCMRMLGGGYCQVLPRVEKVGIGRELSEVVNRDMFRHVKRQKRLLR